MKRIHYLFCSVIAVVGVIIYHFESSSSTEVIVAKTGNRQKPLRNSKSLQTSDANRADSTRTASEIRIKGDSIQVRLGKTATSLNPDLSLEQETDKIIEEMGALAAIEQFKILKSGLMKQVALGKALFALSRLDRRQALEIANGIDPSDLHRLTIANLFIPVGPRDVIGALRDAMSLQRGETRKQSLMTLVNSGEFADVLEVKSILDNPSLSPSERGLIEGYYAKAMINEDPVAAAELISELKVDLKPNLVTELVSKWPDNDLDSMAKWLYKSGVSQGQIEVALQSIIARSFANNPNDAIRLVTDLPPGLSGDRSVSQLINLLYNSNPQSAVSFIENLGGGVVKNIAVEEYCMKIAGQDPVRAIQEVANFAPQQDDKASIEKNILKWWVSNDPSAAYVWIETGSDYGEETRMDMKKEILNAWARSDPDAILEKISENSIALDEGLASVLTDSLFVNKGAVAAADFLHRSDYEKPEIVTMLVSRWMGDDPIRASKWVADLPKGEIFDAGAGAVALGVLRDDKKLAIEWASSISDEKRREEFLNRLGDDGGGKSIDGVSPK